MKKNISRPVKKWAALLLLPAFAGFLAAFAQPEYHYSVLPFQPEAEAIVSQDTVRKAEDSQTTVKLTGSVRSIKKTPNVEVSGQNVEISGQVLDTEGKPVAGAAIIQKDSKTGTVTDMNGKFILLVSSDSELEVSYIDKEKAVVSLKNITKGNISITLKDELGKPAENTGQIKFTDEKFRMRTSVDPLIIVDGKEYTAPLNDLNPENIESVDVLKNSSAISLYGEKGKNGVVIIKTKKLIP